MLETMSSPSDSSASATEGVVIAGSKAVSPAGLGAAAGIEDGTLVSADGCETETGWRNESAEVAASGLLGGRLVAGGLIGQDFAR